MDSLVVNSQTQGYANCAKCQFGDHRMTMRVSVKNSPDGRSYLFHIHAEETFQSFILRLCNEYPETWKKGEVYYFYIDMGGRYHYIEEEKWIRGNKKKKEECDSFILKRNNQ